MNIFHPVNKALIERGQTQTELARLLGYKDPSYVSAVINGIKPSRPLKLRIANELKLPVEKLFPEEAAQKRKSEELFEESAR